MGKNVNIYCTYTEEDVPVTGKVLRAGGPGHVATKKPVCLDYLIMGELTQDRGLDGNGPLL
jgi:hypothetical protein